MPRGSKPPLSDKKEKRRRRDSNPRCLAAQRFSKPPPSATRSLLQGIVKNAVNFYALISLLSRQRKVYVIYGFLSRDRCLKTVTVNHFGRKAIVHRRRSSQKFLRAGSRGRFHSQRRRDCRSRERGCIRGCN